MKENAGKEGSNETTEMPVGDRRRRDCRSGDECARDSNEIRVVPLSTEWREWTASVDWFAPLASRGGPHFVRVRRLAGSGPLGRNSDTFLPIFLWISSIFFFICCQPANCMILNPKREAQLQGGLAESGKQNSRWNCSRNHSLHRPHKNYGLPKNHTHYQSSRTSVGTEWVEQLRLQYCNYQVVATTLLWIYYTTKVSTIITIITTPRQDDSIFHSCFRPRLPIRRQQRRQRRQTIYSTVTEVGLLRRVLPPLLPQVSTLLVLCMISHNILYHIASFMVVVVGWNASFV